MPMRDCRSGSSVPDGSMQELQWIYLVDSDKNGYAVLNCALNFGEKFKNLFTLSSLHLNPGTIALYFNAICHEDELKFLPIHLGRSPRPPPSNSL
jgi:hypothetical protein